MPELIDEERQRQALDRAIGFNLFLRLPEAFDEYLDELTILILDHAGIRNQTQDSVGKTKLATDIFLANLLCACVTSYELGNRFPGYLRISKQADSYTENRYRTHRPGYRIFRRVWEFFESDEIGSPTETVIGFFDRRAGGRARVSRIRMKSDLYTFFFASPHRPEHFPYQMPLPPVITDSEIGYPVDAFLHDPSVEVIRLKDETKVLIGYEDDDYTNQSRNMLADWNLFSRWLSIDVLLNDQQFREASLEVDEGNDEGDPKGRIELQRTQLYRVFNNSSFEQGGRLYGGWWQEIRSEIRRYITIDGMRTVEIDYSNMQPAMLYAMEGEVLPNDAYSLEGVDVSYRKLIKSTFMKMLNAMPEQNMRPPNRADLPDGMTFNVLMDEIRRRHEPIGHHFRSGIGLRLQKDDADIALDIIMQGMADGQLILPIHDSFIVQKKQYGYRLRELMLEKYAERYGQAIGVDVDEPFALKPEIVFFDEGVLEAPEIDKDILAQRTEWLREHVKAGDYLGYRERNQLDDKALENWPLDAH